MIPKGIKKFNGKKYYLAITYKYKKNTLKRFNNKKIWYKRTIKHKGEWGIYLRPVNPFHAQKLGLGK